jgi:hypothetical protein
MVNAKASRMQWPAKLNSLNPIYGIAASICLAAGCLGPRDEIGKSPKLEWASQEDLTLCVGQPLKLELIKYSVDPSGSSWIPEAPDTTVIILRIKDERVQEAVERLTIFGTAPVTTSISATDTSDHSSTNWRPVVVRDCE